MAYYTTNTATPANEAGLLGRVWFSIGAFVKACADGPRWKREIEELQALSDAELARRGLKRDDIARHVIGAGYYI